MMTHGRRMWIFGRALRKRRDLRLERIQSPVRQSLLAGSRAPGPSLRGIARREKSPRIGQILKGLAVVRCEGAPEKRNAFPDTPRLHHQDSEIVICPGMGGLDADHGPVRLLRRSKLSRLVAGDGLLQCGV